MIASYYYTAIRNLSLSFQEVESIKRIANEYICKNLPIGIYHVVLKRHYYFYELCGKIKFQLMMNNIGIWNSFMEAEMNYVYKYYNIGFLK